MSVRGVTGRSFVNSPPSSLHDVRIVLMSASSVNSPSWTARRTPIAATGLLMDAAWNSVSVLMRSGTAHYLTLAVTRQRRDKMTLVCIV
jgi:hypothetical protein